MKSHRTRVVSLSPTPHSGLSMPRRRLAARVLDATESLTQLAAHRDWHAVADLLAHRRALVAGLEAGRLGPDELQCLAALRAAVAESDRALGLVLADAALPWSQLH